MPNYDDDCGVEDEPPARVAAVVLFDSSSMTIADSSFKSKRVLLMESVRAGMNLS